MNARMLETVEDGWRGRFRAFGVRAELRLRDATPAVAREALRLVTDECWRVERLFSANHPDSLVRTANSAAGDWVATGPEFDRLLAFADTCFRLSGGRLDVTAAVLHGLPADDPARHRVQQQVGWPRIERQAGRLRLPPGMAIDFGAMVRDYALDRALFLARQIHTGDLLLRAGSSATAVSRGQPWLLAALAERDDPAAPLELLNGALVCRPDLHAVDGPETAPGDEVLDAVTGAAVVDAPRQVIVQAAQCIQAGMLATLAMINGVNAERFLAGQDVRFRCLRDGALVP